MDRNAEARSQRLDNAYCERTNETDRRVNEIEKHVSHLDEELHQVNAKPRELIIRHEFCVGCPLMGTLHEHYTVL